MMQDTNSDHSVEVYIFILDTVVYILMNKQPSITVILLSVTDVFFWTIEANVSYR